MIATPWASPLPLHLQDLGTSRWQLKIEGYIKHRAPERAGNGSILARRHTDGPAQAIGRHWVQRTCRWNSTPALPLAKPDSAVGVVITKIARCGSANPMFILRIKMREWSSEGV
jgi:hypothetical protein